MTLLTIGPVHTLVVDVVYALPARRVKVHVQSATGVVETSNDGTTFVTPMTQTNGEFETAAAFIRFTTAGGTVKLGV